MESLRLEGKYIISSEIKAKTGLHIGTSGNTYEIGGVDNAVVKDANGRPYIPGSSLKGKMRSLMEYAENLINPDSLIIAVPKEKEEENIRIHMCDNPECPVCNIFGRNHGKHRTVSGKEINITKAVTPTRLIVRDAYLDASSIDDAMQENLDMEWTEVKFENNLDRITSAANPRQTERVPAGAAFTSEMILNVLNDEGNKYLKKLLEAMALLEDDYLGGQGSRGYGKIAFENIRITFRDVAYYECRNGEKLIASGRDLNEIRQIIK
ncbi:MAG: type III-A CRISPR-associated RAMP protein Csm3 [Tepidanaerobacteraceae bacterium]|jgi:CRISPR-associated protein Csm3|nr:type III-A CRISPR-associated RAMP protein Csm3 [Tepidanaerobacteraceae bacterium]